MARRLERDEITRQLADLPGWTSQGEALTASYTAPAFLTGVELVRSVAEVAEEMDHHPDIDIRWRTVHLSLSTHSAGGVTQLDVELAHRVAQEAARLGVEVVESPGHRAPQ
ncbi:4a-hydroxytetrahydrobiopterin dehydratase [Thalassiella azotivora]